MIKISELYIYPVKSLAGIKIKSSKLTPLGLKHDRRWMIVDEKGKFITQREVAIMATIGTSILDNNLILTHENNKINVPAASDQQITIQVWDDTFKANLIDNKVDKWISNIISRNCYLVYMPIQAKRQIDRNFANDNQYVSFADGFPILTISQASLDDLNSRLGTDVHINRFRPNMVINGIDAFAEDNWKYFSINNIKFKAAKPCSRCIIPSINQNTGKKDQLKMLSILNGYRKFNNKIKFGLNIIYKEAGNINNQLISCGDEIILNI